MRVTGYAKLHAGKDAIFGPDVLQSLIGIECNGWTVIGAEKTAPDVIMLKLEGPVPFKIELKDLIG